MRRCCQRKVETALQILHKWSLDKIKMHISFNFELIFNFCCLNSKDPFPSLIQSNEDSYLRHSILDYDLVIKHCFLQSTKIIPLSVRHLNHTVEIDTQKHIGNEKLRKFPHRWHSRQKLSTLSQSPWASHFLLKLSILYFSDCTVVHFQRHVIPSSIWWM